MTELNIYNMQSLEFAKVTSKTNQKTEQKIEEIENKREAHGRNIGLTRKVLRISNSDTFYCQSESIDIYYFIRYESSFQWCSCFDNSMRHVKCKHIFAVEYSIRKGTLKEVEKLPKEVKRDNMVPESYRDDDYDF
jgi:hypothetical protein